MRLLFDQTLSHLLPEHLHDSFPNSAHVRSLGFGHASDDEIWWYARRHDFCLVTQEIIFAERSRLYGTPPKVIWLQCDTCTPQEIEDLLKRNASEILRFGEDSEPTCLETIVHR